jgi:UDP-N-acetylglucosamine 2-epimerase (non-hydrolysing)/GDP/UDP-N,N'-diacetylbacillosamine 2-epimerase (hydrolysing)
MAIERARSASFRESLSGMENPYGDGDAAPRIVRVLAEVELDRLLMKKATSVD